MMGWSSTRIITRSRSWIYRVLVNLNVAVRGYYYYCGKKHLGADQLPLEIPISGALDLQLPHRSYLPLLIRNGIEFFMLFQDMTARKLIAFPKATRAGNCIAHPDHLIVVRELHICFIQQAKLFRDEVLGKIGEFLQCWVELHNFQDILPIEFGLPQLSILS